MIGENTPLRPQVRRGWLRTPGQPSGALVWWDGQKYRTVNPSAPYPLRTKRSMNSVSTTAAHVVLAMTVVVAIAGVLFWLLLPVAGLLFFLALVLYAMPTTVRSRWSGVSNKDRGAIDAYLTYLYENYCPDGWKVDNSRSTIADQQDALRILGVHKNVVAHGFRPIFPSGATTLSLSVYKLANGVCPAGTPASVKTFLTIPATWPFVN